METFVKIGFAKISIAAPKIWVGQNLGEKRVRWQPPAPPARTLMSALSPVSSIKHIKFQINFTLVKAWMLIATDQLETVCVEKSAW